MQWQWQWRGRQIIINGKTSDNENIIHCAPDSAAFSFGCSPAAAAGKQKCWLSLFAICLP